MVSPSKRRAAASSAAVSASPASSSIPTPPTSAVNGATHEQSEADAVAEAQSLPMLSKAFDLANLIAQQPERLATIDDGVRSLSVEALKEIFDFSLLTERDAVSPISAFIESVMPQAELHEQRASRQRKRKRGSNATNGTAKLFDSTPLPELFTEGMQANQLWEQIDLKGIKMSGLMEKFFVQDALQEEEEDEEVDSDPKRLQSGRSLHEDDDDDEDDDSDDDEDEMDDDEDDDEREEKVKLSDLSDADLRALGIDPSIRDQLLRDEEGGDSESDDEGSAYAGASDISDGDPTEVFYEPLKTEAEQLRRKEEQEGGMLPRLRSQVQNDWDEDSDSLNDDELDDEDLQDDDEDGNEDSEDRDERAIPKGLIESLDEPGSSAPKRASKRHPTLDDDFFSIDDLNRQLDEQDAAENAGPTDDNDDDDLTGEVDYFAPLSTTDADDEDKDEEGDDDVEEDEGTPGMKDAGELHFADFFLPPTKAARFNKKFGKRKASARFAEQDAADDAAVDASGTDDDDDAEDRKATPATALKPDQEEPDRKRRIRFNDTIEFRRIKARKKSNELTHDMLQMLGAGQDDVDAAQDYDEDDDENEDDDDDMDMDEVESETSSVGQQLSDDEDEGDDEDDVDMEEDQEQNENPDGEQEDDVDEGINTARRVAGDLFAESDDEDESTKLSTHERRVAALRAEIERLEQENVGKKDWTLMGEAGSRARPQDSLLEQDLEFERAAKVTPQVTEEMTESIEELIKRRILDKQFDDVVRRRELEALPFLPSRLLELSDSKSAKSLAELYEEEYQAARGVDGEDGTGAPVAEADAKLAKEHDAIAELYEDIFNKLDALSNAHFTPKAPKATIQTISNAPVVSIESALPSIASSSTMLAPEEVYERAKHSSAMEGAKSEMTPEEKQRLHNRLRQEKRHRNEKIQDTRKALEQSGLVRAKKVDATQEKQEALKKLVGNRGVSVIGKDPTAAGAGTGKKGKGKGKAVNGASAKGAGPTVTGSKFKL
ncbi:Mpp10-domain-containing protein [Testicularia cyperi]|uniref:Mpp10-domain-containing protein n=1 Tax=Testicularia cyperi TaxID=1882483 RepID=A0A317XZR9_9BASI|nr:Mpp10-domain-containing protein [Testicularia cyperi]